MQTSLTILAKKAIDAALKSDWVKAIELNLSILQNYPDDLDAKLRLGRAYIQTKNFEKAKKIFKEILKKDPINQIALKNLDIATKRKTDKKETASISILKEPGTTAEVELKITSKGLSAADFVAGESLGIKVKKRSIDLFKDRQRSTVLAGIIDNLEVIKSVNKALDAGGTVTASFLRGKDREARILFKSSVSVFKAERQDVRPYIKSGSLSDEEDEEEEHEVEVTE